MTCCLRQTGHCRSVQLSSWKYQLNVAVDCNSQADSTSATPGADLGMFRMFGRTGIHTGQRIKQYCNTFWLMEASLWHVMTLKSSHCAPQHFLGWGGGFCMLYCEIWNYRIQKPVSNEVTAEKTAHSCNAESVASFHIQMSENLHQ